jgi:hypothetical protein
MPYVENLGSGGGTLDAQYGSSSAPNTNAPLLLDPRTSGNFVYTPGSAGNYVSVPHADSLNILGTEGVKFLSLPGENSQFASSPDATALDITGDIDLRARLAADNWSDPDAPYVLAKSQSGQRSYAIQIIGGGLVLYWTTDGSTLLNGSSTAAVPFAAGQAGWIRATIDVDNGAGGRTITFYTAPDSAIEPTSWNILGTAVTQAGVTSIFSGTAPLEIGSISNGGQTFAGKIYRAVVLNGINGTTVFDADFTQQTIGSRGFIESTGKLVTLNGAAAQIVDGTTYGFMPGVTGGWTTPNVAALNVSDLEITARVSLNDWTPAANQALVARYTNTGPSRSYICYIAATTGRMFVQYTLDGTTILGQDWGGTASPFTDGQTYWLRYRRIAATGVWRFDWAPDSPTEPTVWTNVGGDRAGTAGALFNATTAPTSLGAFNEVTTGNPAAGRMFRAIIRNANTGGTKVLDADFTRQIQFASSFTEATGKVVTTVGAARIERARDMELVVRVALDDWTPSGPQVICAKAATGQFNFRLSVLPGSALRFLVTADGTNSGTVDSGVLPFADGVAYWLRVRYYPATLTVAFEWAPDSPTEPTVWTSAGSVSTTTGSMFPGNAPVEFGRTSTNTQLMSGKLFRAVLRNGINGPAVLDLDFTQQITSGSQSVVEPASGATIPQAVQFAPNLGTGGAALNARYGSTTGADTNDPLLLEHTGTNYLDLPGSLNNYGSAPSAAPLNPTGVTTLRVEVDVALDAWNRGVGQNSLLHLLGDTWEFASWDNGTLLFLYYDAGLNYRQAISTTPVPFAAGERGRVAVEVTSGGVVTFFVSYDGVTWSQLQASTATGGTGFRNAQGPLTIGTYANFLRPMSGKYYRATIKHDGTTVFDANFTTGITSGGQTTFTESSSNAATVTINRSTSGRKSVAVVRDVWLFGTDDYMEVPDNDLLDFGAGQDFTAISVARMWGASGSFMALLSKVNPDSNSNVGWQQVRINAGATSIVDLKDGSGSASGTSFAQPYTSGAAFVLTSQREGNVARHQLNLNAPTTGTATTLSLANSLAMRIGATGAGSALYADMEFYGGAIFRRALSPAEIALVNTHYQTGPTAASNALLSESVWWIDASRTAAAQINRSTTGRKSVACADCVWLLGTDDFFEVADNPLLDFDQGEDFTLMSLVRVWDFQGTNDSLIAKSSSNTPGAAGYGLATGGIDPLTTTARLGDGSTGASVSTLARVPSRLVAVWAWRDTATGLLHVALNNDAGSSTADLTTGNSANSLALRLGALSGVASEFLDGELKSTAIWRRKLTAAERAAVNTYYGTV